jgi:hypothetical protein
MDKAKLEVGMKVVLRNRMIMDRIVEVKRVTAKFADVEIGIGSLMRFNRTSWKLSGTDHRYSPFYILPLTEEDLVKFENKVKRESILAKFKVLPLERLSLEALSEVETLIDSHLRNS